MSLMLSEKMRRHVAQEHKINPFSTYLQEIVYGGNDGIITTFAVVAGFNGASQNPLSTLPVLAVLIFGFANLFADSMSMGLGNFLSLRSEQGRYRALKEKELLEIRNNPSAEKEETIDILTSRGFTKQDAQVITSFYSKNEDYWAEFMMKYELEMATPLLENPYLTGLATILAFMFFGFIPLTPYLFLSINQSTFILSTIFAFAAMIVLGLIRWRVTKDSIIRSVGEIVFVGGIAAVIAYFVGSFFKV